MLWRRLMNFINNIQACPSPFFVELVVKKGSDVMNINAMEFIHDL
jgi:hypothetical protein